MKEPDPESWRCLLNFIYGNPKQPSIQNNRNDEQHFVFRNSSSPNAHPGFAQSTLSSSGYISDFRPGYHSRTLSSTAQWHSNQFPTPTHRSWYRDRTGCYYLYDGILGFVPYGKPENCCNWCFQPHYPPCGYPQKASGHLQSPNFSAIGHYEQEPGRINEISGHCRSGLQVSNYETLSREREKPTCNHPIHCQNTSLTEKSSLWNLLRGLRAKRSPHTYKVYHVLPGQREAVPAGSVVLLPPRESNINCRQLGQLRFSELATKYGSRPSVTSVEGAGFLFTVYGAMRFLLCLYISLFLAVMLVNFMAHPDHSEIGNVEITENAIKCIEGNSITAVATIL